MAHFKTKLATFCMQTYIAFFTQSFGVLFAHFTTSLRSWSSKVVYFIKSHVLWKFRFTFWSISGFLIYFKEAKGHLSLKLQMRYLLLANLAIYPPFCNDSNIEKVYEQGPVPFFFHILLGDMIPANGPSDQHCPYLCYTNQ